MEPIYLEEDPIATTVQIRTTECGFDQGVVVIKGREPKPVTKMRLIGKGLDIPDPAPAPKKSGKKPSDLMS